MTGALSDLFLWIGSEVLLKATYFFLCVLFWLIVLPVLLITLTPVFLVTSAACDDPFVQTMKRKYKRLVHLWADWTTRFP